jgi:hypothetical protein
MHEQCRLHRNLHTTRIYHLMHTTHHRQDRASRRVPCLLHAKQREKVRREKTPAAWERLGHPLGL